jgi:PPOX class probable F420-dependent enzyme
VTTVPSSTPVRTRRSGARLQRLRHKYGCRVPNDPIPANVIDFLRRPHPAVMATVAADGRPMTVATWYLLEDDGRILLGLDATRARLKHLYRDPRISLTVLDSEDWYTQVSLQGRVGEITEDIGLREIDALATHYTGAQYGDRSRPRVATRLQVERWHVWGSLREDPAG